MDHHYMQCRRLSRCRVWQPVKCSLFVAAIVVGITFTLIQPSKCQRNTLLNSPPILHVPERNWRISETEQIGQIITRIRADDAENDELVFGLEPHFHSNYVNPNDDNAKAELHRDKLPFRIDPVEGVVYLNESLSGWGGENFFLYITVSDGQLTAKNEIFVNVISSNDKKKFPSRPLPSIPNIAQNISRFLPVFDQLPGVQSIRNKQPNTRPSNNLQGFGINSSIFSANRVNVDTPSDIGYPLVFSFNPNEYLPMWENNKPENKNDHDRDIGFKEKLTTPQITEKTTEPTRRTKLTPISGNINSRNASVSLKNKNSTMLLSLDYDVDYGKTGNTQYDASTPTNITGANSFRTIMIPVIIAICGLLVTATAIFGILYRKRLCAFSQTLKKKSKEEMVKKSNQSSTNSTDGRRNSIIMQHWNGPMAFGNRYVPWERDQQLIQHSMITSQLSSVANGVSLPGENYSASFAGSVIVGGVNAGRRIADSSSQNTYDRWEFQRHRLKFFNILGEGAFGQVWRCEATDIDGIEGVTTVAVKTLKENTTEIEKKDLLSEIEVMKSLEPHANVVRFLGCCTDKDPIFVIIEYVNRGKLQTYLRNSRAERHYGNTYGKSNILTSGDLTSFMYQVAKGMDYLTSRGIIHRDLAARNILIAEDHSCKVADFGFARDIVTSKVYERKSEGKLPIRWMAIESLYDNIFSIKSDIWSFGILMWEIVTLGSTPYPGISAADVMRKVRDGYRLEKPEHCRRELYNIMYYCWSSEANERPTFSEIVKMLDKLLHTEMDYIELERFPDHNYYNILNLSGEKL